MAVTTIHFQLTCVKLVAKRDRLLGLMPNVNDLWIDRRKQTRRQVTAHNHSRQRGQYRELVNPAREMKLLHSIHHARRSASGNKQNSINKQTGA